MEVTTNGCGQQEAVVCLTRRQPALRHLCGDLQRSLFLIRGQVNALATHSWNERLALLVNLNMEVLITFRQ